MAEQDLEERLQEEQQGLGSQQTEDIGQKTNEVAKEQEKKGFSVGRMLWDAVKLSPIFVGSALAVGSFAPFITTAAFGVGYLLEQWKNKEKTTYQGMKTDLWTGTLVGAAAYYLYSAIDVVNSFVDTTTLYGKIIKTAVFNPLLVLGFSALYRPFIHIRDNIGIGKFFKGLFNFKAIGYLKDAYKAEAKEIVTGTAKYSLTAPMHFYSLNYVDSVPIRLAIGGIGDTIYRLIMGKKKVDVKAETSQQQIPQMDDYRKKQTQPYRNTG